MIWDYYSEDEEQSFLFSTYLERKERMAKVDLAQKKCITPEFRLSFPALAKPVSYQGQDAKYSIVMLFRKKTDITALKRIVKVALEEQWGSDKAKWPKGLKMPFRDGDEKDDTVGYADTIFCTAKSKESAQPGMVDARNQPVIDVEKTFYAGCYCRAEIIAYAFDVSGNKGVGFSLQNIQKLKEGEKFSGRKNAEDVFEAVEDAGDDEDNYDDEDEYELD